MAKGKSNGKCRSQDRGSYVYLAYDYANGTNYCILKKPSWFGLFGKGISWKCNDDYSEQFASGTATDMAAAKKKACPLITRKR